MSNSSSPSSKSMPSRQCTTTRSNSRRWQHTTIAVVLCTLLALSQAQPSHAFSLTMMAAYKPPVKSSVSKIRNNRYSSSDSSSSNPQAQKRPSSRSTTQKSAYVGALAPPTTQQQQKPRRSFESRMRDLVLGQPKQQSTTTGANKAQEGARSLPTNVFTVETLQDYKKIVGEEREKLVAVRFFAPWCRACKAMAPIFYHLANKHQNVVFVDVPVTPQNTAWCMQGLGVQSLPYGHIYDYQNGGLVEELSVTKKHMAEFEQKLESCMDSRQRRGNNGSNVDDETSSSS